MVRCVVDGTSYEEYLKHAQKDFESRWENVQELLSFATQFQPTDDLNLNFADLEDPDEPYVLIKFAIRAKLKNQQLDCAPVFPAGFKPK